jgi:hypothetical protein
MIVEDIESISVQLRCHHIDHEYGYDGAGSSDTISARSASKRSLRTRRLDLDSINGRSAFRARGSFHVLSAKRVGTPAR